MKTTDRKVTLPVFQDAPIYHRLIAERGDVPARVRDAAASIRRDLEAVIRIERPMGSFESGPSSGLPATPPPAPPNGSPATGAAVLPYSALPPGSQQR